jgi:metallo-beta-lactamase family protein
MPVTVTPLGAARTVTGSRHLIEADGLRVLVDCGLYQERDLLHRNWEGFPIPPSSIDVVILTHAHLDHSGYLPKLVRDGFRGPIYATSATSAIVPILLKDSAHIQAEDAATKLRRHRREGRSGKHGPPTPLYTQQDVERAVARIRPVAFDQRIAIADRAWVTWMPAGHILGAAILFVFSGDLGRPQRPIVPDPTPPPMADAVVVESTYGDRLHEKDHQVADIIADQVLETVRLGGRLLIPTFAVERAQEVIWHLDRLHTAGRLPHIPVFLDSPMAVELLHVFNTHPEALDDEARDQLVSGDSPFSFEHLKLCRTVDESKAINDVQGPAVIIAGSGMCNGGRIKHHLERVIDDPKSCILFTGYQAHGTLGRLIVDGVHEIRLFNRMRRMAIRVAQVHGFSGHADRDECLAWLASWPQPPGRVIVVHGGESVAPAFAELVHQRFGVVAHAPLYQESVTIG